MTGTTTAPTTPAGPATAQVPATGLAVRGLEVGYGDRAVLTGTDLDVPAGAFTAVLGPSGCGKTTLLRALAGFEPVRGGQVRLGDRLLSAPGVLVPPEHRRIGLVPQDGALFGHLDVAGNVGFGLRHLPRAERDERVRALLDLVGLPGLGRRRPAELSGGQQQRVALARALAREPDLVLLDEPFGALDAGLREGLRHEVRDLLAAAGTTAVLVTHDQDEALSTADLVAVLRDGRTVQAGTPQQVYGRPADAGVAAFVGIGTVLPARRAGDLAHTPAGLLPVVPVHDGPDGAVVVRPEMLDLVDTGSAVGSTLDPWAGVLAGTVVGARYEGGTCLVRVLLDDAHAPGGTDVLHGTPDEGAVGCELRVRAPVPPPPGAAVRLRLRGAVPFVAPLPGPGGPG